MMARSARAACLSAAASSLACTAGGIGSVRSWSTRSICWWCASMRVLSGVGFPPSRSTAETVLLAPDVHHRHRRLGRDARDGAPDVLVEDQVAEDEDAGLLQPAHDLHQAGVHGRIARPPSAATTPARSSGSRISWWPVIAIARPFGRASTFALGR